MSYVSVDHKLCFIHVPKAAGTSISESLVSSHPHLPLAPLKAWPGPPPERWNGTGHFTINDYCSEFGRFPGWSFAIIRNPYERCASAFMVHPDYGKKMTQNNYAWDNNRLYHEWEKYLIFCENYINELPQFFRPNSIRGIGADRLFQGPAIHALPSHYMISIDNQVVVDKLISIENLEKIPSIIEKNTGIRIDKIDHKNRSDSNKYWDLLLTNKSKKIIERLYAKDFELYEGAE